ncbi:MAG: proton-conducting transporter membrane subunit [Phototrophicaceae bacterium]
MGFDVISEFLVQAFTDRNLMPWLIPLGPLSAFALISLITLVLWLVRQVTGSQGNMIPASDHHYHDHNHPDYDGMDVAYQPDWFRVTAVVIGMSGIVWALIISWTLVFGALNDFGAGTFGLADSAAYHSDDSHSEDGEEAVAVEGEDEAHSEEEGEHGGSYADCAPCIYGDEITWMSLGTDDGVYGVVPDESTDYEIGVVVDPLNLTLLFMVPIAMLGIFIYSIGYMAHDPRQAKFFALISLFAGAMFVLTIADNLMMLFVGWEIMGFCSYSLIGFWYEKKSAYKAAIKAFTVTRVADVVMLLGIVYLWSVAGTLNFRDILYNPDVLQMIGSTPAIILSGWGLSASGLIGVFLLIGTIGKSAQFPLHVWLPDAMEGPTPVSAMIHAAAMVSAGVYAIIRMYPLFVGLTNPHASDPTFSAPLIIMAVIGSFTALFAATMGVAQRDVKAVLAYSTISQLGFMVAALGVGAYIAATFHLITHAFFKALLFMASGSVIHAMEHGEHHVHEHHAEHGHDDHGHDEHGHDDHGHDAHFDPQDMFNMGGLSKRIPVTFWTFVAGGFSLAGFPLITAGFWSKDEILAESWYGFMSHGSGLHALVFFMLAVAAFLTAFYTMRQISLTFLGKPRTEEAEHAGLGGPYNIVSITMQAPLILLAVFALLAGFIGVPEDFPLFGAIFSPEHNYFHHLLVYALPFMENGGYEVFHVDAPAFNIIPVLVSFAVALGGLWLGWEMYGRKPLEAGDEDPLIKYVGEPIYTALQNRYYMDDLYDIIFVRPAQWLSKGVITLLDKGIIDTILHTIGAIFTVIGDFIKVMNAWLIDGVGDGIPKGIYSFGGWLRRTQNGRIQYYLLIVLAAVLIIGVIFAMMAGAVQAP